MGCGTQPNISAEAKGHGISAKAPWGALLVLAPSLNSSLGSTTMGITESTTEQQEIDSLSSFLHTCTGNTHTVVAQQPDWYARLSKINDLFDSLMGNLDQDVSVYGGVFALRCHSAYLGACRCALAGQIPEAHMLLRGCLEAAIYGLFLDAHPQHRSIWHNRHRDQKSAKKLKSIFTIRRLKEYLRSKDKDVHDRWGKYYEYTIDLGGHPNVWSIESHLNNLDSEGPLELRYLHPITNVFLATLKSCAVVGITGLDIFAFVFPSVYEDKGLHVKLTSAKNGL